MSRRPLTDEERAEAARLMKAWLDYKAAHKGATQTWLAEKTRLGTQGAIGQYLRGVIPLNLAALFAICDEIEADPLLISPRLTQKGGGHFVTSASAAFRHGYVKELTHRRIRVYGTSPKRGLNDVFSDAWLEGGQWQPDSLLVIAAPDDSMSKRIRAGDTLLVNTLDQTLQDGAVVAFAVGDRVRVKRTFVRFDGHITLRSDNQEFPDEVAAADTLQVIGRVVALVGERL